MLRIFLAAFFTGIVIVLLLAGLWPLPEHVRYRSEITALANGGRQESFFIRLPQDRIGKPKYAGLATFPLERFAQDGTERIIAQLFRIRDGSGNVIGIASKMTGPVPVGNGRSGTIHDWTLLIPTRGALLMRQGFGAASAVNLEMSEPDESVAEAVRPGAGEGVVIDGTDEFKQLRGKFIEEMSIDRVDEQGVTHGRIEIKTVLEADA